jgi:hypothetical protein
MIPLFRLHWVFWVHCFLYRSLRSARGNGVVFAQYKLVTIMSVLPEELVRCIK